MVPRTAHFFTNEQTVGERTMVVSTLRAYREEVTATAHQDHVLAISLPQDHPTIGKIAHRESIPEIEFWSAFSLCHTSSPQPLL
jgi:hypothetical protein